jgi:hypothetical protein
MRSVKFALAALLCLSGVSALAQAPSALDFTSGGRPGHEPGRGESFPKSDRANNISTGDTKSGVAPTLPPPSIGEDARPDDYLRDARAALVAGHTGQAQQSLEMAETRSLDRSIAADQNGIASDSHFVAQIRDALRALGGGDNAEAIAMINLALAH